MLENAPTAARKPLAQSEGTRSISRIAIKAKRRILFVDPAEVLTVEAQSNYVLLRAVSGSGFLLLGESMSNVTKKLLPYGFVRVHRSALGNAAFVEEIHLPGPQASIFSASGEEKNSMFRISTKRICISTLRCGWERTGSSMTENCASSEDSRTWAKEPRK
jgi:hypothetical protein